jgi:two-component system phosphate regulon sensor histidine kinase PhoR
MSIRGIGDGYAFQRLLWLLVGTVIVPTILLSLFGLGAIRNQQTALQDELDRVAAIETRWTWERGEPVPPPLAAIGLTDGDLGEGARWFVPGDGSAPIAVRAEDGRRVAVRVDAADLVVDRAPEARASLSWNGWWSIAGMTLLVALVIVGAVITLGSASREIRLSRLQTDFVSNMSHELRTPLTAIALFVETLRSGRLQDPGRVQECLDLLARETDRLSRRIERVLDWARMEAGRRVYDFESCPPRELCDEALRALRSQRLLQDDPDGVAIEVDATLPTVRADRDAIVEALLNLLQNATKYTPPPRRIRVSALRRGAEVGLCVEDNGPGIEKRHRRRIFEKFYQADTRLSTMAQGAVDRGSGLGLSIVRAVARAHDGHVELDSEVGRGSRFTLWLPVADRG